MAFTNQPIQSLCAHWLRILIDIDDCNGSAMRSSIPVRHFAPGPHQRQL